MTLELERLAPRVKRCANAIAAAYGAEPDDVAQDVWLGILETARKRPDILSQTDAYIVKAGEFHARNRLSRQRTYTRHTTGEEADLTLSHAPRTDADTTIDLEATITSFPPRTEQIVRAIGAGFTRTEIAAALKVSVGRISQIVQRQVQPAIRDGLE